MAIKITQGENAIVKVLVTDKATKLPYDFTGFASASASFLGSAGLVTVTGTQALNVLTFPLTTTDTAALQLGEQQDMEYRWLQNSQLYIERISGQVTVEAQLSTS